ncbi:FAD/NAD(P)-binding domain-containing protein [Teratosphaeria destructans]|uniref:FAD/NAD(P)-binding domain-containing protein n=1 Tax=Teratosphaeria destructans TaxID=418781 RepID=A0A9W7STS1_9PEZI|nr:FAD/NAD(P)-binding domain-containing protein [Teratosphaeria destructans]
MASPLHILISGSGIAGGVLTWWLLRAYPGVKITIVERAPSLRLTGQSVDIRSSAVDIIKKMSLEETIRHHGTNEKGWQFVDREGKEIATLQATGDTDVQTATSEYEIFRGELAKIFLTPVLDKVDLVFNESVESYEENDNGVHVTFAHGKTAERYDLLVAADGLGSHIRSQMLNAPSRDQINDLGIHVAYFTISTDLLNGSQNAQWYNAPGGRVVFLRPDPNPLGRTRANLIHVTTPQDVEGKKRLNDATRDYEQYKKILQHDFRGAGWLSDEVLDGMDGADDFYANIFAQVRSPSLRSSGGRVVLLGDAGYATPGFGTSLAIIGGYVLAGELLSSSGNVKVAVQKYEELMLPFVKRNQGSANNSAPQLLNPQTARGIWIRDKVLRLVVNSGLATLATKAAAALGVTTDKKLDMPDYPWPSPTER